VFLFSCFLLIFFPVYTFSSLTFPVPVFLFSSHFLSCLYIFPLTDLFLFFLP
jgi:hypothetical protein